jgi:hypothetical protein
LPLDLGVFADDRASAAEGQWLAVAVRVLCLRSQGRDKMATSGLPVTELSALSLSREAVAQTRRIERRDENGTEL